MDHETPRVGPSVVAGPRKPPPLVPARFALYAFGGLVLLFLTLPTLIVIPMSFSGSSYLEFPPRSWSLRWYHQYFDTGAWQSATLVSLKAAALTTLFATPLGAAAAYGLHLAGIRLRNLLQLVILVPMIVPVILIGLGVYFLYAKLGLNATLGGIVIADVALAVPFVVVTIMSRLKSYDMTQELAARSLGASRLRAIVDITLPQIGVSIAMSAFLAFMTSLDEVVVALFISGGDNTTITKRMFSALRDQIDPTVAAISTCLIAASILLMLVLHLLSRWR